MKPSLLLVAAFGAALLALAPHHAQAQIISQPQIIQGTVRFSNMNPAVLGILNAPSNQGLAALSVFASGISPTPPLSASTYTSATSRTSSPYQITVESDPSGYTYNVSVRASLDDNTATYWFAARPAPPVTPSSGPVTLNFAECAGMVNVRFVNASGAPVAVTGGNIRAYHPPDSSFSAPQADRTSLRSGSTEVLLVVRADEPMTIHTTVQLGTSTYTDRLQFQSSTNITVPCDTVMTVNVVVPSAGALGQITGKVDVLREFELTVDGYDVLDYADYTGVIADYGPFGNKRYAHVAGVNFTVPASGPFSLNNLLPDSIDPASPGYTVYAQAFFRTNRQFAFLRTPALGSGSNPPVNISAGGTVNLGNRFVIDPGYIRGRIFLRGPTETGSQLSLLRGVSRAAEGDLNHDGIPEGAGIYGVYWSSVSANGMNRRAAGATYTAAFGSSAASFEGEFNPANSAFEGNYELVAGGLDSERSLWKQESLTLNFNGGAASEGISFSFFPFCSHTCYIWKFPG